MNPQLSFLVNRQFWAGVGAAVAVGILFAISVPNLARTHMSMYEAKRPSHQMGLKLQQAGYSDEDKLATVTYISATDDDRKMIRNASIDMLVKSPKQTSDKIRALAEQTGGFLVSSETYGGEDSSSASLTIRVPVQEFEKVRGQITSFGLRVESEKLEAQDVTKQYVDQSVRLRNLHAQEMQYLGILKQAQTVKDTVEVSEKLGDVRGQIEQQQAEFDVLSKQVATVALTISLHAEADAQVLGLHWRPLYQLKLAARDGVDGIGDYATAMASFIFYIPTILLWTATLLFGAAIGWRIVRRVWRVLFTRQAKTS